ncbi:hydroxylase [Pararhizobium polonicum]|uniref:Hydroxylase n=2 Tax=Pararhizobium polonicum TaxID=1612624 RepID=A0A1C7NT14_9HYPH|nr:hydroxylase [Pararhizobium polonicum]
MAQSVADRINEAGPELAELAWQNERLGKLSDRSAQIIREAGVMRILQPCEHGGLGGTPADFLEAVMTVARHDGSAGWVCGVVGVHPWEVALFDPKLGHDIWGQDQETWIASPYTPTGIAEPVEGGYRLTGRWQFSSGTDHSDWVFLGALLGDGKGRPAMPPRAMHLILPRPDYSIIDDSWDVIGLLGTGSKDVAVNGAFVPAYRAIFHEDVASGAAAQKAGLSNPIYKLPFSVIFPVGITGAIIGMAEGALAAHGAYQRDRVSAAGAKVRDDPYAAYFTGEAASEIHASRVQLLSGINWAYDQVTSGREITFEDRSRIRRNQIRCAWRAVAAIDTIYARSGGNASRRTNPIQRFWRDAHVGLNHFIHVPGPTYHANAMTQYGLEPPEPLRMGI